MSAIDHKPQRFLDFEAMIADPNWLAKLGPSITDEEQAELLRAMDKIIANEEANEEDRIVADSRRQGAPANSRTSRRHPDRPVPT